MRFFSQKIREKKRKIRGNTKRLEKILSKSGKILRIQQKLRKFGGKRTPKIMENTKKMEKILQKIRKDTPPKPKIPESKPLFQL